MEIPAEEQDVRLSFTSDNWREIAEKIITRLTAMSERMLTLSGDNYEGVRAYVSYADGYFIVRTSVHDPVLPIYIESNKSGGSLKIARLLYSFLNGFSGLDCAPLYSLIEELEYNGATEEEVEEDNLTEEADASEETDFTDEGEPVYDDSTAE